MKIICHAPFRLERHGPLESAVHYWENKLSPFGPFSIEYCAKRTTSERDVADFYQNRMSRLAQGVVVALDEQGTDFDSLTFAQFIAGRELHGVQALHFCLGGAYGLPREISDLTNLKTMRLSSLTFSHELALAVLLEQIYRARTILKGHPYHHGLSSPFVGALVQKGRHSPRSVER